MPSLMIRYALFKGKCCYCGTGGKLEVDHVLPLSLGGLDDASNIAPACRRCNASKNASPVEAWYRRQPFFTEVRWRKIQRHCPAAVTGQLPLALPV
jgi:5-methylcytosine-specific restriction endonuclease McrA